MAQIDLRRKLSILADAAKYDASCASSGTSKRDSLGGKGLGSTEGMGICHAYTPDGAASWDGDDLAFGPPASRDMAPAEDEIEGFWRTYYASAFNPARLKTKPWRARCRGGTGRTCPKRR